jgi:cytosine/adenosine deaminase-related metal-dependent hydrolase
MAARSPQVASRLLLNRAPWDAIASEWERQIPFDDPAAHTDGLSRLVMSGAANCYHVVKDGERIGIVVTKVEESAARELVVVAIYSASPEPISPQLAEAIEDLARAESCISIRFHTIRAAAARYAAERHGYRLTELVMRKSL